MSEDCSSIATITPHVSASKPYFARVYPISVIVSRTSCRTSTYVSVEISPATTTRPVVMSVSQATRPIGSSARTASRTESEIWSAILSGWPSVTDSEVNRKLCGSGMARNTTDALVDLEEPFERHGVVVRILAPEEERLQRFEVRRGIGDVGAVIRRALRREERRREAGGVGDVHPEDCGRFVRNAGPQPRFLVARIVREARAALERREAVLGVRHDKRAAGRGDVENRFAALHEHLGGQPADARLLERGRGFLPAAHHPDEAAGAIDQLLDQRHGRVLVVDLGRDDEGGLEAHVPDVRGGRVDRESRRAVEETGDVVVERHAER